MAQDRRSQPRALLALLLGTLIASASVAAQPLDGYDRAAYVASVKAERAETDAEFRDPRTSPLDPRSRLLFERLSYFPIDPAYRLAAEVEWIEEGEVVAMLATDSSTVDYRIAARLHFTLGGAPHTLTAYTLVETISDSLFVPFQDATTDHTTFNGGRSLSVPHPGTGAETADLDFNKASNPSCAYSPVFPCVAVPPENVLSVGVEAGVRKPQQFLVDASDAPLPETWLTVPVAESGYEVQAPFDMPFETVEYQGYPLHRAMVVVTPMAFIVFGAEFPFLGSATEEERNQIADLALATMTGDAEVEVHERWIETLPSGRAIAVQGSSGGSPITARTLILDSWIVMLAVLDLEVPGWEIETEEWTAVAQRFFESLRRSE
ncbi:MAG: DUF1684 domain-containing protein [Bacteroidota bacterium]